MKKKLVSVVLALCLALPVCVFSVSAEPASVTVENAYDFLDAFNEKDGVVTIPEGAEVTVAGEVVFEDKTFRLVNNGTLNVAEGAVLDPCDCSVVNNGVINIGKNSEMWANWGEGLENHGEVKLDGKLHIGAIGAVGDEPARVTLSSDSKITGGDSGKVVLYDMDAEHPADLPGVSAELTDLFDADIFIRCRTFDELYALNSDERVEGVFLRPRMPGELVRVNRSFTLNTRLWIWNCDLLLENGNTMTVDDYESKLMMDRDGRIVSESEGAAGPECPKGGTLVLNGVPLISGESELAAINPTGDIIWLGVPTVYEDSAYPLNRMRVVIGDHSEAMLHGDISALDRISVVGQEMGSRMKLTDDFKCARVVAVGVLDLDGHNLTVTSEIFYSDSEIIKNGGEIIGKEYFEAVFDLKNGEEDSVIGGWGEEAGVDFYLEEVGVDYDKLGESFLGWRVCSPWDVPQEELDSVEVLVNNDEADAEHYGMHYFKMPAYPVHFIARRDGEPQAQAVIGDVNGDGDINVVDATAIQKFAAGIENEDFIREAADVNGDGKIDVVDATQIQRYAAGLHTDSHIGEVVYF